MSEIAFTESTTKPENRGHHKDTSRADTLVGSGEMVMLGPREDELSELANTLSTARRERLDMAHRNALRLLKLVNTLPDFSTIEARRMNANYEATDLATCTAELASAFRSATEKGGRSTARHCPNRYTSFAVTVLGGCAHLPSDLLGEQSLRSTNFTGAAAYVGEAQHWISDSSAASTPLSLPVETADCPHLCAVAGDRSAARPRILWANDNADMLDYVRRLLEKHYDVAVASDGTTALTSALATPPDLVLTDFMMPGREGMALLGELRANERTRTIPVILLTARAREESAVAGLEPDADDYLVKPFSARELLARVATHLQMGKLRREWAIELERRIQELAQTNDSLHQSEQRYRLLTSEIASIGFRTSEPSRYGAGAER